MGYTVITADSGEAAIDIYGRSHATIDVVILDMIMPGLNGRETYKRLRQINPDVRVLLASGYAFEGQEKEILEDKCNGYIQKPFKIEKLAMMIKEIMERDSAAG
jgi:CheY-like chemotaxis protein